MADKVSGEGIQAVQSIKGRIRKNTVACKKGGRTGHAGNIKDEGKFAIDEIGAVEMSHRARQWRAQPS